MCIPSARDDGCTTSEQATHQRECFQHPGYVCAFATSQEPTEIERLNAFAEIDNGFDLAQADLRLRGPGNLFSTQQTGFPPLMIADLTRDEEVLQQTQEQARSIISDDPDLADPGLARLRQLVLVRYGKALEISDVG